MLGLVEPLKFCIYCSVLEVSASLAITGAKQRIGFYSFSYWQKRDSGWRKIHEVLKVLAARHLHFLKCSLLAKKIWQLFVLAKINTLLAYSQCSQRPFDTHFEMKWCQSRCCLLSSIDFNPEFRFKCVSVTFYSLFLCIAFIFLVSCDFPYIYELLRGFLMEN